jgi:hypothetical protein
MLALPRRARRARTALGPSVLQAGKARVPATPKAARKRQRARRRSGGTSGNTRTPDHGKRAGGRRGNARGSASPIPGRPSGKPDPGSLRAWHPSKPSPRRRHPRTGGKRPLDGERTVRVTEARPASPQKAEPAPKRWPAWSARYLAHLAQHGRKGAAARAVGLNARTVRRAARRLPDFRRDVEQARTDARIDHLADRARAHPSVANLVALLRVLRPEEYGALRQSRPSRHAPLDRL